MIEWIIWGIVATAVVDAILNWSMVRDWLSERLKERTDYARLVEERLKNGKVRVRAGVFTAMGRMREEKCLEGEKLDDELKGKFRYSSDVRITV
jgi:hypothetical protein